MALRHRGQAKEREEEKESLDRAASEHGSEVCHQSSSMLCGFVASAHFPTSSVVFLAPPPVYGRRMKVKAVLEWMQSTLSLLC